MKKKIFSLQNLLSLNEKNIKMRLINKISNLLKSIFSLLIFCPLGLRLRYIARLGIKWLVDCVQKSFDANRKDSAG